MSAPKAAASANENNRASGPPPLPPELPEVVERRRQTERWILRLLGKVVVYGLLIAAALWMLWRIRGVVPPFLAALLLVMALAPLVDRLEARGLPRWAAVTLVYLGFFGTLTGMMFVLVPLVANQIGQVVTELRERFHLDEPADVSRAMAEQVRILGRKMSVPAFVLQPVLVQAKSSATLLTHGLESFGKLLVGMLPSLVWVIIVPIVGVYGLIDYHRIFAKTLLLVPRVQRDNVRGVAADVSEVFSRYLRGLLLVCFLDTAATIGVLLCFPTTRPYAAALGLVAGVLYAVPYLGAIFSTALIALVAFAAPGGGPAAMLWVTLAMVLLHQVVFDQVISPRVLGGQVGLHPILSILALLSGDALFGIGGMLLAVPAAASLQVIIVHLLPRLARHVDVQVQKDPPDIPQPQREEARREPIRVTAGEGITSTPTSPPPKPGAGGG